MAIKLSEAILREEAIHVAHAFIWAPMDRLILGEYYGRAAVLMQMRFDGCLGLPGGIIDDPLFGLPPKQALDTIVKGLNRELEEEVNVDWDARVSTEGYVYSEVHPTQADTICHLFTMELTMTQFEEIEHVAIRAKDFADEVMGNFRVPLYTMKDGARGFPNFLKNNFIAPAKTQLYRGLMINDIFSLKEIRKLDPEFEKPVPKTGVARAKKPSAPKTGVAEAKEPSVTKTEVAAEAKEPSVPKTDVSEPQ